MTQAKPRALVVRKISDRSEVHRIDVTGKSERHVELVERGILRNMDTDLYFLDDTDCNPDPEPSAEPKTAAKTKPSRKTSPRAS